jgi:hypothetical protein
MAFIDLQVLSALQPLLYAFAGATYHSPVPIIIASYVVAIRLVSQSF